MISIRRGTFETNSSSTHTICICREDRSIDIPDEIVIEMDDYEFGWEYEQYVTTEEKLAYIIFGILNTSYNEGFTEGAKQIDKLLKTIGKWVKKVSVKGIEFDLYDGSCYFDNTGYGYVDHASELSELIDALLEDAELLKRYLFSTDSYILTGNDNSEGYPEIKEDYAYDEFEKGN